MTKYFWCLKKSFGHFPFKQYFLGILVVKMIILAPGLHGTLATSWPWFTMAPSSAFWPTSTGATWALSTCSSWRGCGTWWYVDNIYTLSMQYLNSICKIDIYFVPSISRCGLAASLSRTLPCYCTSRPALRCGEWSGWWSMRASSAGSLVWPAYRSGIKDLPFLKFDHFVMMWTNFFLYFSEQSS